MIDLGVDINKDWNISNNDLNLVSDEDNICQAIANRLGTYQPSLAVFYTAYGGFLNSFFGRKKTQETLDFMRIEINNILSQEPRLETYNLDLSYDDEGKVHIDLRLDYNEEYEDVELNLVLSENGLEVIEDEEEEE
jgi:phage baseplate assembly protein W